KNGLANNRLVVLVVERLRALGPLVTYDLCEGGRILLRSSTYAVRHRTPCHFVTRDIRFRDSLLAWMKKLPGFAGKPFLSLQLDVVATLSSLKEPVTSDVSSLRRGSQHLAGDR